MIRTELAPYALTTSNFSNLLPAILETIPRRQHAVQIYVDLTVNMEPKMRVGTQNGRNKYLSERMAHVPRQERKFLSRLKGNTEKSTFVPKYFNQQVNKQQKLEANLRNRIYRKTGLFIVQGDTKVTAIEKWKFSKKLFFCFTL